MRFARLVPLVLVCGFVPAQEKKYDCVLKKIEIRGGGSQWFLDLTFDATFPEKSILNVTTKMKRHEYLWQAKELVFGVDTERMPVPATLQVSGKSARSRGEVWVATPGLYEIFFYFEPTAQTYDSVKKTMGKSQFYRHEFPIVMVAVGEPKKTLVELRRDTDECAALVKKALEYMDRIERESDDKDWADKAEKLFEEVNKMKVKAEEQAEKSLHGGAYRVISDILEELVRAGRQIKMLKEAGKAVGGGGGGGDEDPPTNHPEEGDDKPILGSLDGKMLTLDKLKEHIRRCGQIRMREFASWITVLHQRGMEQLDQAYADAKKDPQAARAFQRLRIETNELNEELEKTYKHIATDMKFKEAFEAITTYSLEEKEQRYAEFFSLFKGYVLTLSGDAERAGEIPESVKETQKKVKDHLETAQAAVRGKKK